MITAAEDMKRECPSVRTAMRGISQGYLEYAVLFYQRYGPEKDDPSYLNRLEDWVKLHSRKIPSSCCGGRQPVQAVMQGGTITPVIRTKRVFMRKDF